MVSVSVEGPYSYRVPPGMPVQRGSIVAVPLVGRLTLGVVWGAPKDNFAHNRLKDIATVYDVPPLSRRTAEDRRLGRRATRSRRPAWCCAPCCARPMRSSRSGRCRPIRKTGFEPERMTPARDRVLDTVARRAGLGQGGDRRRERSLGVGDRGARARRGARAASRSPRRRSSCRPIPTRRRRHSAATSRRRSPRSAAHRRRQFGVALLDGVTGSGKTEVFFEAVADTLRAGRQALILLPEIALTHTFLARFTKRFGTRPAEWHSDMTPAQRTRTWRGIINDDIRLVLGARSALFLPFHELGLIVLDEEHDGAFKQSDGVNYHARDMAVVRAKFAGCAGDPRVGDAFGRIAQQRQ